MGLSVEDVYIPHLEDQTRGIHAGLVHVWDQLARDQAGPGAVHGGPGVAGRGQLRGDGDVRGVRARRQGDGRSGCHSVFHHRCRGLHTVRWVDPFLFPSWHRSKVLSLES